ncbi:MAG: tetratricopeptide repeat protein [Gemmatimonadota bacterium]
MTSEFWSADEFDRQAQQRYEDGEYDAASSLLETALRLYPESADLWVSMGYTQLAREEYAWARRAFDLSLVHEPDHEDGLVGVGEALLKLGERSRGFRSFERVLELGFATDSDLMASIGRALFREGLYEHAERFFRKATAADQQSAAAAADLAYSLQRLGKPREALSWLRRALELDSENHDARICLANLEYESGHRKAALEEFERVPTDRLWDPLTVWRAIELTRAFRTLSSDGRELDPYLERLERLLVKPTPVEELLAEIQAQGPDSPDTPGGRGQLDMFRPVPRESTDWAAIVRAMSQASPQPHQSVEQFMQETAERIHTQTGIRIPDDDPEAFIKASAQAGVLHIEH